MCLRCCQRTATKSCILIQHKKFKICVGWVARAACADCSKWTFVLRKDRTHLNPADILERGVDPWGSTKTTKGTLSNLDPDLFLYDFVSVMWLMSVIFPLQQPRCKLQSPTYPWEQAASRRWKQLSDSACWCSVVLRAYIAEVTM